MSQATNYSLIYRGLKANFMPGFIGCNQILFLAGHLMSQATSYTLIERGLKANFMPGFIGCNQILFLAGHIPPLQRSVGLRAGSHL
ncbi:MAG: hypothetical protein ACOY9Y_02590 [Bacillota bacterium]